MPVLEKPEEIEQAPALESYPKVGFCAECGEPAYEKPSGSCCKNGHGGAGVLVEPPKPKEEKSTSSPIDFSSIDPDTEWECFGIMYIEGHPECKECPFAKRCKEKKNSK